MLILISANIKYLKRNSVQQKFYSEKKIVNSDLHIYLQRQTIHSKGRIY
jgi:hypothetical protein